MRCPRPPSLGRRLCRGWGSGKSSSESAASSQGSFVGLDGGVGVAFEEVFGRRMGMGSVTGVEGASLALLASKALRSKSDFGSAGENVRSLMGV